MKAKQITYGKVKSCNFNNEKIEIVLEVEEGEKAKNVLEKAKQFVNMKFGEIVTQEVTDEDIPF
jgi:hypothetical protein